MSVGARPLGDLHVVAVLDAQRHGLAVRRAVAAPTTITDLLPSSRGQHRGDGNLPGLAQRSVPVMETFTGVPTFSLPDLLSILSQTSTVVLPGSSAGLISETFAATGSATPGTCTVRLVAHLHLLREALRNVRLGQQRRSVHHRDQRRAGGGGFAGEERPVGHHAVDGAANLGVVHLRLPRPCILPSAEVNWPCADLSAASRLTLRTDSRCFAAAS